MSDTEGAKRAIGGQTTAALLVLSVLALLISAAIPAWRRAGDHISVQQACLGTGCMAFCAATFVLCPRDFFYSKLLAFFLLLPTTYAAILYVCDATFTSNVLRFFHGLGI